MTSKAVEDATALFAAGSDQQGLDRLKEAARAHDAGALEQLAGITLAGKLVPRDAELSRELYAQAAQAGSFSAARILCALLGNGTGGARDWPAALGLLTHLAQTDDDLAAERSLISAMALDETGEPTGSVDAEIVSTSPDTKVFRGLLTHEECDFMVRRSSNRLQPSLVVDPATGQQIPHPIRTSDATSFPLVIETPAIHALCRRIARATGTDVPQGEPLQVLRYRPGQEYRPHFDSIDQAANQRVLTVLVYLNDDYDGGATLFPESGYSYKGAKGDALAFRNSLPSGAVDPASRHAGTPVTGGTKYLATRWIREFRVAP